MTTRRSFLSATALAAGGGALLPFGCATPSQVGATPRSAPKRTAGSQPGPAGLPSAQDAQSEGSSAPPAPPRGPIKNVLWICTDQQRWDTLGVTGNSFVQTPNLDRLANEGVLFERAYCNNPVCMPSRASFLTGTYPSSVEVTRNGHNIPDKHLPRLMTYRLHEHAYNCGLSGKLHIRADWRNKAQPESGYDHGYDEFNWSPCGYPANWAGCQYQHWLRDKGVVPIVKDHPDTKHVQLNVSAEHHQTTWCAQRAITFIEAMGQTEQPWLFSCNIFDPHNPFDPPPELLERYYGILNEIPLPNYKEGELKNKPKSQRAHHERANERMPPHPLRFSDLSPHEHRLCRAAYFAMIDLVDQQVGRILDALERSGQRENTLVIFTSDHGESLGDHGLYWKDNWFYEESVRVPLILSWPGMKPQKRRVSEFAELVDIAPTVYDAIGIDIPDYVQGRSWWSFLNGGEPVEREAAFGEHRSENQDIAMWRKEHYKLVYHYHTGEGELYDLRDPHLERVNRFDDPDLAQLRQQMLAELDAYRKQIAPVPLPSATAG